MLSPKIAAGQGTRELLVAEFVVFPRLPTDHLFILFKKGLSVIDVLNLNPHRSEGCHKSKHLGHCVAGCYSPGLYSCQNINLTWEAKGLSM